MIGKKAHVPSNTATNVPKENNKKTLIGVKKQDTKMKKVPEKKKLQMDLSKILKSFDYDNGLVNIIKCKPNQIINPSTFRCINKDSKRGKELLEELESLHMPFNVKKGAVLLEHPTHSAYFGMIYLSYKYKNDCVVFGKTRQNVVILLNKAKNEKKDDGTGRIIVRPGFWEAFSKCKQNKRFVISPLSMGTVSEGKTNPIGHANYLIYDTHKNELERYEPHGKMSPYTTSKIDELIESAFVKQYPDIKYISPLSYCPNVGFQKIEGKDIKIPTDKEGFCAIWSLFYADLRLGNPSKTRDEVMVLGLALIKNKFDTLTRFITDYSDFLMSMRDKYLKELNEKKIKDLDEFFMNELKSFK